MQKSQNRQEQLAIKQGIKSEQVRQKSLRDFIKANESAINQARRSREVGSFLTADDKKLLKVSDAYADSVAKARSYAIQINTLSNEFNVLAPVIDNTDDGLNDLNKTISKSTKETSEYISELDKAKESAFSFAEAARALEDAKPKRFEDLDRPDTDIVDIDPEEFKVIEEEKLFIQQEYIDLATDYFIKRADERIDKIQEETNAATSQADYFKQLAAEGNISAKESLAEQNRLIAESNAQKAEEEKRKQRILLVSSVLQAYNSNLETGDTSGEAFTKALTSTTLLQGFISALPAFYDGTENTSLDGKGKNIDGRGGFHAVLHQNERVLTANQNDMIGNYSNQEVATIMQKHRLGELQDGAQVMVGFGSELLVNQLMDLKSEMASVKKAIEDKPVPNIELGEITQSYMNINKRVESSKGVTTSRFKVK